MSALVPLLSIMLDSIQQQLLGISRITVKIEPIDIGHCQAETFLICSSSQYLTVPYNV